MKSLQNAITEGYYVLRSKHRMAISMISAGRQHYISNNAGQRITTKAMKEVIASVDDLSFVEWIALGFTAPTAASTDRALRKACAMITTKEISSTDREDLISDMSSAIEYFLGINDLFYITLTHRLQGIFLQERMFHVLDKWGLQKKLASKQFNLSPSAISNFKYKPLSATVSTMTKLTLAINQLAEESEPDALTDLKLVIEDMRLNRDNIEKSNLYAEAKVERHMVTTFSVHNVSHAMLVVGEFEVDSSTNNDLLKVAPSPEDHYLFSVVGNSKLGYAVCHSESVIARIATIAKVKKYIKKCLLAGRVLAPMNVGSKRKIIGNGGTL